MVGFGIVGSFCLCGAGARRQQLRPGPDVALSPTTVFEAWTCGWMPTLRWVPAAQSAEVVVLKFEKFVPAPHPVGLRQVVSEKLTGAVFDTAFVAQWTAQISEACLHGCRKLDKPFKFIGT